MGLYKNRTQHKWRFIHPVRPALSKTKPRSDSVLRLFCSTRRLHAEDEDGSIICTENAGSLRNADFCSARRGGAA